MTTKFKVGDKVRIIDAHGHCHPIGGVGIVREVEIAATLTGEKRIFLDVEISRKHQWVPPEDLNVVLNPLRLYDD